MSELRVLSLGWGVQSWTIAAMIAKGELEPVDYALHADTSWERSATYDFAKTWSPWLAERGVEVRIVQSTRTDIIQRWKSETAGIMIPAYTLGKDGSEGVTRRHCTSDWKIYPMRRFVSSVLEERGIPKAPGVVDSLQGISWDEATRSRTSDVAYITNVYPLLDERLTRQDCIAWLEDQGLPTPNKSACVFCPYHSRVTWQRMARSGGPDWDRAVEVDERIRDQRDQLAGVFVHPSRQPLTEAVTDDGQTELWPEASCDSGYCFT